MLKTRSNSQGFTLVELIVVIVIIAILGTIGFISFQGYTITARDSSRITEVRSIAKLLDIYRLKSETYPLPDDKISITASGALVGYQGYAGKSVFGAIGYSNGGLDPLDKTLYTYYTLPNGKSMQILALMEKEFITGLINSSETYAALEDRFPMVYGNSLGIITGTGNVSAQSISGVTTIDLINSTGSYIAHVHNDRTYEGVGNDLRYAVPLSSCQRILDANLAGANGFYTIYPIADEPKEVYCRFDNNEGYTLIARSVDSPSFNGLDFGWLTEQGDLQDSNRPYSLGSDIMNIPFEDIYLGTHNGGYIPEGGETRLTVTDIDLFDGTYTNTAKEVDDCSGVPITIQYDIGGGVRVPVELPDSCDAFSYWGNFGSTSSYFLSPNDTPNSDGLNPRRYGASFPHQGLIFVK